MAIYGSQMAKSRPQASSASVAPITTAHTNRSNGCASPIFCADLIQSTRPSNIGDTHLRHRPTAIPLVPYNTPSDAQHAEVVHHLYRQQTRALPTIDIRSNHPLKPIHIDLPEQEPFYTPHEKIAPVDDELFAKTLQFKLWTLAQELGATGEQKGYVSQVSSPQCQRRDIETRCWDTLSQTSVSKKCNGCDHIPSIWRMHERRLS
ncbi:hypothetical protein DM02DRAFT_663508 [Periconia macrospinosa]|uniref:Uncharacterized protein n=1 Tax=Periconia macrospinosa TaxID=97972 RepID=A0A2V1D2P4_9PLEO|nr:hypothetical protein DM02DRAFT_663508 [Periconia macrospinosa]